MRWHNDLMGWRVAFLVLWAVALGLWVLSVGFAAERKTVRAADGADYDVLVNPDGVMVYGQVAAWTNLYGGIPALVGLVRRLRGRTGWVVRVRPSPYRSGTDLSHEVLPTRATALARQAEVADVLRRGRRGPSEEGASP